MPNKPQTSGSRGEAAALARLQASGLRLLASNWRCRTGELDLVMLEGDTVVFVEVRYRRHIGWGGALASVDRRKQQKLVRTAAQFLQSEPHWNNRPCRFDVVALGGDEQAPSFDWIRNAFDSQ